MFRELLMAADTRFSAFEKSLSQLRFQLTVGLAFLFFYLWAAQGLKLSFYTPDSWAYYELAATVFSDHFYEFTTWRSYLTGTQSAAFPVAYPVAIALVQAVLGPTAMAAVWVNVVVAAAVWLVALRQTILLGASAFSAFVLSTGLLLWPPFMTEVFAGRSIPMALLFVLLALSCYQARRPLLGGLCLGLAALTRFDFMLVGVLFILAVPVLERHGVSQLWRWVLGYFLGASPWIAYSLTQFNKLWVSDNSWVALSALPAFVTDFPAKASATVFDSPGVWLGRVLGNVPELLTALFTATAGFPALLGLLLLCFLLYGQIGLRRSQWVAVVIALAGASLAPYLLTGYFDQRYFATFLLAVAIALAAILPVSPGPLARIVLSLALLWCVVGGGTGLAKAAWDNYQRIQRGEYDRDGWLVQAVYECHIKHSESTLIFPAQHTFAARYGATTGMPAALLPGNYSQMSPEEKQSYLQFMQPFLMMDDSFQSRACDDESKQQSSIDR